MIFPDYEPIIKISNTDDTTTETTNNGTSFLFNFEAGDFVIKDGKIQTITELNALKVWIQKVLLTEKYKYKIYKNLNDENEYGIVLNDLIYSDYSQAFIQAELQREITETLLTNNAITNVSNFNFSREKRRLVINFDVESVFGNTSEVVNY